MTVLYNQFCITDIVPDLKTKTIVILTNFKVDASTINLNTVSLYDYSAGSNQLANYSLQVDGKAIGIVLDDFPPPNTKYYLKVTDIYDALNRKINYSYNDYIEFTNDVITHIDIISPAYRETFTQNIIDIKLKIKDPLSEGSYKIQISSDNAFFKTLSTIVYNISESKLTNDSDVITITEDNSNNTEIDFKANIDYNGQLFIRARAEKVTNEVGVWSDLRAFTMHTMSMDSIDTTFLEPSLTTFDLFEDELNLEPLAISNKSNIINTSDVAFYMEFNKAIKLPEGYKANEDGYVSLGYVTGFRKGLK
jgi:hypothetical protein